MLIKYTVLTEDNKYIEKIIDIPSCLSERQIDMYLINHNCILNPKNITWEVINKKEV